MKVYNVKKMAMDQCLREAQEEGVVLTRDGSPVAVLVGVEGLDLEQLETCQSAAFWNLIRQRRKQKSIDRKELEKRLTKD